MVKTGENRLKDFLIFDQETLDKEVLCVVRLGCAQGRIVRVSFKNNEWLLGSNELSLQL